MAKKADEKKLCFVVGPIGDDGHDDRIHADWLLEEIIEPVFREHFPEFITKRADKIADPGRIDAQVIAALLDAELVIADLTTLNPNAFYEIGIRHTVQRPIIHMHLEGQRIPFDIASFRSIKFARKWPKDLKAARTALEQAVRATMAPDYRVDNPVTVSRGKVEFDQTATPPEKILLDQLSALTERVARVEATATMASMSNLDRVLHRDVNNDLWSSSPVIFSPDKRVASILISGTQGTTQSEIIEKVAEYTQLMEKTSVHPDPEGGVRVMYLATSENERILKRLRNSITDGTVAFKWIRET